MVGASVGGYAPASVADGFAWTSGRPAMTPSMSSAPMDFAASCARTKTVSATMPVALVAEIGVEVMLSIELTSAVQTSAVPTRSSGEAED